MQNGQRRDPLRVEAKDAIGGVAIEKRAAFIFLHGYGDDAEGFVNIAHQFQSANKLPYLTWIFPNAPHHHESMSTAWYTPTAFSPIPVGSSSSSPQKDDEDEQADAAEDEILASSEYICTLIDEEVKKGIRPERILIGGFSQGCAISLVTGLGSRYQGKIGGVVALSGYLPHGGKLSASYRDFEKEGESKMKIFLAHGTKDMLVPMRIFRDTKKKIENVVGEGRLEAKEYEGMPHATSGIELRDVCTFLEKIIPA